MAIERLQAGAQSATFYLTDIESILTRELWAALPNGKLRDLLMGLYASKAAFMRAASAAGFTITVTGLNSSDRPTTWYGGVTGPDEEPLPNGSPFFFVYVSLPTDGVSFRLQVSYSASE